MAFFGVAPEWGCTVLPDLVAAQACLPVYMGLDRGWCWMWR